MRKSKHSRLHTIFILDSDRTFIYEQDGEEDVDFEIEESTLKHKPKVMAIQ